MAKPKKLFVLPPAKGAYVALAEPKDPPKGSTDTTKRYGVTLLYPKADLKNPNSPAAKGLAEFKAAAIAVANAQWPGKGEAIVNDMKDPLIRDGDAYYRKNEDPTFKGMVYVRATTKADPNRRPPGVVNAQAKRVLADIAEEAYSGCIFRTDVTLTPYDKANNKGIGIFLNNVQVVSKGERMDGRREAEDAFAEFAEEEAPAGSEE